MSKKDDLDESTGCFWIIVLIIICFTIVEIVRLIIG